MSTLVLALYPQNTVSFWSNSNPFVEDVLGIVFLLDFLQSGVVLPEDGFGRAPRPVFVFCSAFGAFAWRGQLQVEHEH